MSAERSEAVIGNEPFDFEALSDAAEKGLLDGVSPGDLKDKAADPTPETPAKAADPAPAGEVNTDDAKDALPPGAVIKTPDGKHEIPARELTETRRRNAELREANAETNAKLVELSDKFGTMQADYAAAMERLKTAPVASKEATAAAVELGDMAADLASLQADLAAIDPGMAQAEGEAAWLKDAFGPQAKSVKAMAGVIAKMAPVVAALTTKVSQFEAERQQFLAGQRAEVAQTVDEAIANNPVIAAWQDAAGDAWEEAKAQDAILRERPAWASKSFAERFAEVQKRVVGVLGQDVVPEHLRTKAAETKDDLAGLSKDKVIAAGQAKLKDAKPGIQTLSDLPGGTPAAASIATELDDDAVSVARLEKFFENKSQDDITAMFRT